VFNGTSTPKGQFVPICQGGNPVQGVQLAKDGQRKTKQNASRYTITM